MTKYIAIIGITLIAVATFMAHQTNERNADYLNGDRIHGSYSYTPRY